MKASRRMSRRNRKSDGKCVQTVNGRALVPGPRPLQYLKALERDYEGIGRVYDLLVRDAEEPWPAWCYCPMTEAFGITWMVGCEEDVAEVARIGALAAWRATKGIYPISSDTLERLSGEPAPKLSAEWITRLPEWCVYVEFPEAQVTLHERSGRERALKGAFAWLSPTTGGEPNLWLLADTSDRLLPPEIVSAASTAEPPEPDSFSSLMVRVLHILCSTRPRRLAGPCPERGGRVPPAQAPCSVPAEVTVWETTFCRYPEARPPVGTGKKGTPKRPHTRVAHEHRYWVGSGENRRLETRWLTPVNINQDGVPELPTRRLVEDNAT